MFAWKEAKKGAWWTCIMHKLASSCCVWCLNELLLLIFSWWIYSSELIIETQFGLDTGNFRLRIFMTLFCRPNSIRSHFHLDGNESLWAAFCSPTPPSTFFSFVAVIFYCGCRFIVTICTGTSKVVLSREEWEMLFANNLLGYFWILSIH